MHQFVIKSWKSVDGRLYTSWVVKSSFGLQNDVYSEWKKSTNDNEKPSSECYRPFIVVIFFPFKNVC